MKDRVVRETRGALDVWRQLDWRGWFTAALLALYLVSEYFADGFAEAGSALAFVAIAYGFGRRVESRA